MNENIKAENKSLIVPALIIFSFFFLLSFFSQYLFFDKPMKSFFSEIKTSEKNSFSSFIGEEQNLSITKGNNEWVFKNQVQESDYNNDGLPDVYSSFNKINDSQIEVFVNDTREQGSYKWSSAICNLSNASWITKEEYNPNTNVWTNTGNLTYATLTNFGLPSSWCNETGGKGFVLFGAGSGDKQYRLNLPEGNKEIKFYTGKGTEQTIGSYQETKTIHYDNDGISCNWTLQVINPEETINDLFIHEKDTSLAFGGVLESSQNLSMQYVGECNNPLNRNFMVYEVFNDYGNKSIIFDLEDVCNDGSGNVCNYTGNTSSQIISFMGYTNGTHITIDPVIDLGTNAHTNLHERHGLSGPYWNNETHGVVFWQNSGNNLQASYTTDKGNTWTTNQIKTDVARRYDFYFDRQTPGNNGDIVHVIDMDFNGKIEYINYSVRTNDYDFQTVRTFGVSVNSLNDYPGITVARNGDIILCYTNSTEFRCDRSTDNASSWSSITAVQDGLDHIDLHPANTGDNGDIAALYWDADTNEISIKMYNATTDSWTETAINSSMSSSTIYKNMFGTTRHSDGHILASAHTNDNTATDELITWDINPNSISSPTITYKTNVFTNVDESAFNEILINQQNDDVYITYYKGLVFNANVSIFYKKSTDGMTTWGSETFVSDTQDDIRSLGSGKTIGDEGGNFLPSFQNDDTQAISVDNDTRITFSAVTGGGDSCTSGPITGGIYVPSGCIHYVPDGTTDYIT